MVWPLHVMFCSGLSHLPFSWFPPAVYTILCCLTQFTEGCWHGEGSKQTQSCSGRRISPDRLGAVGIPALGGSQSLPSRGQSGNTTPLEGRRAVGSIPRSRQTPPSLIWIAGGSATRCIPIAHSCWPQRSGVGGRLEDNERRKRFSFDGAEKKDVPRKRFISSRKHSPECFSSRPFHLPVLRKSLPIAVPIP